MTQATVDRINVKNPENSLLYKLMEFTGLKRAFALVALNLFLDWAMKIFAKHRAPGQIVHTVVADDEPAGKPIKHCRTIEVHLSVVHPNDVQIKQQNGSVVLRMARILRMTWQAYEQGGLLSYEDLTTIMAVDKTCIKDLVKKLTNQGFLVPTRGLMKDMGRAPSHKEHICRLLCRGYVYTEICAMTGHSEHSIERYAIDFGKVIALRDQDAKPNDIRIICDMPEGLVRAYMQLYDEHNNDEFRQHLDKLKLRFEACEGITGPGQYSPSKKKTDPAQQLKKKNFVNGLAILLHELLGLPEAVSDLTAEKVVEFHHQVFPTSDRLLPGQTVMLVDSADSAPKYSRQAQNTKRPLIPVVLSPWTQDKIDILNSRQPMNAKRALIADALAREAQQQGGTMTIGQLAFLLATSRSEMAACLANLRQRQDDPTPIKGITEDAGSTLTHKETILDFQDQGFTPPEISRLTLHSPESRDNYLKDNLRVETLIKVLEQIPSEVQAARFLGKQRSLVRQYLNRLKKKRAEQNSAIRQQQQQPAAADSQHTEAQTAT